MLSSQVTRRGDEEGREECARFRFLLRRAGENGGDLRVRVLTGTVLPYPTLMGVDCIRYGTGTGMRYDCIYGGAPLLELS